MRDELAHIGTKRHSGRYPWGSGENPEQRNKSFLTMVDELSSKGLNEVEIAQGLGMTTTELRNRKSNAKASQRAAQASEALRLKDSGMSNVAIGQQMQLNESSVRALLDPAAKQRSNVVQVTSNMLKEHVDSGSYLDVGLGVENRLGISQNKLGTAVALLKDQGYKVFHYKQPQLGTGNFTDLKALVPPDTTYSEFLKNLNKIKVIGAYTEDSGRSWLGIETPRPVSSKRVAVRYAEEGGDKADGVIEIRRGVDDISLGGAKYAQVRIAIDGTHYLKGMAMYSDDLPDGVDLRFNTNKSKTANKLDAMKPMKDDPDNPFGSVIRQKHYVDEKGKKQLSALNIVNEEDSWSDWSRSLSSQVLSKQSPALAKEQLGLALQSKQAQYAEIMALTNPVIRKKLLEGFADDADSAAVHLKAAALPRQKTHVILPINSVKDTEIYAPNYRDGERVALVRFPHGGTFEIPELTVNNRVPEAKRLLGNANDAVGINAKVAARLSGADFDGDTVLVIPNNSGKIKSSSPLAGLKNFDPQTSYPAYEGMKPMRNKQQEMGNVSNLITDMTIMGAPHSEIARAVRHSMVVIDAEKHNLNYRQSAEDNGIKELKAKYQGSSRSGASTLISRASSEISVPDRKPRSAANGGPVDPATGKKMYEQTGASYINRKTGKETPNVVKSTKLAETDNAHSLVSKTGTPIESVYADHANKLKALANESRKAALQTKPIPISSSAKETYKAEVDSLSAKLNLAIRNKPIERQAQLLANATVTAKRQANPDMESSDIKKIKGMALAEARSRTGAKKEQIVITPSEWDAIQAGAVSTNKLTQILNNADLDQVKKLATPHDKPVMSKTKIAQAQRMLASGYTQAEIADHLGVPTSTLNDSLT